MCIKILKNFLNKEKCENKKWALFCGHLDTWCFFLDAEEDDHQVFGGLSPLDAVRMYLFLGPFMHIILIN